MVGERVTEAAGFNTLVSMKCTRSLWGQAIGMLLPVLMAIGNHATAQSPAEFAAPSGPAIASLDLPAQASGQLQHAVDAQDYLTAEKLLLAEIERDPHSARAARLLAYAGTVYFLNEDYLHAAVAWKKSAAITPLDPKLRFTLAMAYIRMNHADWARKELESLAAMDSKNALFVYWLGRLDYDGHEYNKAIAHFQMAIQLDPQMARAYDNLGLCYYYQNQNGMAISNYEKAIELGRESAHPSAWPYLNLAITQQFLNQPADAETNLRQALQLDPKFAKAHFQLGTLLEDEGKLENALAEMQEAARLDAGYAEPHMAMARVDHKLGREDAARSEVQIYLRLHPHSTPQ